ncbi:MAG: hypothetical protein ACKO2Y_10490 [Actinomycetota bacterium]
MSAKKDLAAARAEAEAAQADFVQAVGSLGLAAGSARAEATCTAPRFAPIAIAAAGALMAVSVLRKLR